MISKQIQEMAIIAQDPTMLNETQISLKDLPTNLSLPKTEHVDEMQTNSESNTNSPTRASPTAAQSDHAKSASETKVHLSFSVDRLLNCDNEQHNAEILNRTPVGLRSSEKCCDKVFQCCQYADCFVARSQDAMHQQQQQQQNMKNYLAHASGLHGFHSALGELKSIVRPTPIRAMGSTCESATICPTSYPGLAATTLLRYHQQQQQHLQHKHSPTSSLPLLAPLSGYKPIHPQQHQHFSSNSNHPTKAHLLLDIPNTLNVGHTPHHSTAGSLNGGCSASVVNNGSSSTGSVSANTNATQINNGKRKRSWSRAVFSNLQRKGLEIQFQQQKYITKPDRRRLAARLNLTDAQVKVWFQNRRMKWRHTRENLKSGQEKQTVNGGGSQQSSNNLVQSTTTAPASGKNELNEGYTTDEASSSVDMSEHADEDDEEFGDIDVVE